MERKNWELARILNERSGKFRPVWLELFPAKFPDIHKTADALAARFRKIEKTIEPEVAQELANILIDRLIKLNHASGR